MDKSRHRGQKSSKNSILEEILKSSLLQMIFSLLSAIALSTAQVATEQRYSKRESEYLKQIW